MRSCFRESEEEDKNWHFFFHARQGCPLSKCICTANAIFLMILKKHKVRVGKEKYEICPLATCDFYEILKYFLLVMQFHFFCPHQFSFVKWSFRHFIYHLFTMLPHRKVSKIFWSLISLGGKFQSVILLSSHSSK